MTEAEWLVCTDPKPMLEFLLRDSSRRKLRLFGVACCHRIQHLLPDPVSHAMVDAAERFADGRVSEEEMEQLTERRFLEGTGPFPLTSDDKASHSARDAAWHVSMGRKTERCFGPSAWQTALYAAAAVAWHIVGIARSAAVAERWAAAWNASESVEFREQVDIIQDIFGNPFRSVDLGHGKIPPKVVTLAQSIYDERAFDRLPVLADALEEAGCTNGDILAHCRQPGEHVRGCWVIDLLLGKE